MTVPWPRAARRLLIASVMAWSIIGGGVCAARAATVELGAWSGWKLYGGTTNEGQSTCGLATSAGGDRLFLMQHLAGEGRMLVRMARQQWARGQWSGVGVRVHAGGRSWDFSLFAWRDEMRFWLPPELVRAWGDAFQGQAMMTLEFPGSNEAPWIVPLSGVGPALHNLGACIRALGDIGSDRPGSRGSRRPTHLAPSREGPNRA